MFRSYIIAMAIAVLAVLMGVILGDYGPWYLSWFLGTGFMVLVAVSAGVLFEAQEEAALSHETAGYLAAIVKQGKAGPRP